ncbi:BTB domain-containing protein [Trichonephila inaurata madagascariensis]|uniref:BTB domain-containing protein n=1 Tax=Trichonephila inaurata madagascariensis TaxID=2747483 RepID=A0A8X7C3L3_9ARAC|nr:BTB domain-containing protein [Trichonephila inaurata madagascariensis]
MDKTSLKEEIISAKTTKPEKIILKADRDIYDERLASDNRSEWHSVTDKYLTDLITINNIQPEIFQILLHFMYTLSLKINCQNVAEVYKAAENLHIKQVMAKCIQIMRANDVNAYIYKYAVAWYLGINRLKHKFFKLILRNLEEFSEAEEFMNLNVSQICEILIGASLDWVVTDIERYVHVVFRRHDVALTLPDLPQSM